MVPGTHGSGAASDEGGSVTEAVGRRNEGVLGYLRALAIAALTWIALAAMHVQPGWLGVAIALAAGGLSLVATDLGVLVAVVALSIPLLVVQPVLGLAVLIVGVIAVPYLGADSGAALLVIGVSLLGAFLGPVWAGVALAGYLLGSGEGALAAAVACLVLEVVGVMLGRPVIGVTITGAAAAPLASFAHMPATLFSAGWVRGILSAINGKAVNRVVGGFTGVKQPLALVVQPALWAAGAAVAGLGARSKRGNRLVKGMAAVALGVLVPAVGGAVLPAMFGLPVPTAALVLAALESLVVALLVVALWESVFPPVVAALRPQQPHAATIATEDADVDELLRLIATAEDQLQAHHSTDKVVLITDMKSFSRMTEEDGTVVTAKAIQRHRDLLLPIVSKAGGSGKSTGGDGLVAAFDAADVAVSTAAAMQQALVEHNAAHPNEREMWVRMGIASGEVVLDNGGCPFIGNALNIAARVMNLADGGQIFVTGEVAHAVSSADVRLHSFGDFELKNIAKPVEVVEALWSAEQSPRDPRIAETSA